MNDTTEKNNTKDALHKYTESVLIETKDELLCKLKEKIHNIGVKKNTLSVIIKFVMESVEETPIKGVKQKEYALKLLKSLIDEYAYGDDKEFLVIAIESGSIADTIDLIASAAKGELNVNKVVDVASRSLIYLLLECCVGKNK